MHEIDNYSSEIIYFLRFILNEILSEMTLFIDQFWLQFIAIKKNIVNWYLVRFVSMHAINKKNYVCTTKYIND